MAAITAWARVSWFSNGGTLQTATTGINSATRTVYVNSGTTSTFDTNGFDSSLGGSIFINAPLTKAGAGNLTFSGTATNAVQFGAAGSLTINSRRLGHDRRRGLQHPLAEQRRHVQREPGVSSIPSMLDFNGGAFSGTGQILIQSTGGTSGYNPAITDDSSATPGSTIMVIPNIVLNSNNAPSPRAT